jgi:excisionase family DNA binding protein
MTQLPISIEGGTVPRGLTRADLMTARQVAELLGVPLSTVHEWGRRGVLPRVKLGRHVRFVRAHVERAILGDEQ